MSEQKNTILSVVPAGCTRLCQLADVSWNAPFKASFRDHYATWIGSGEVERTPAGNMRAVSKRTLIELVKKAWDSVSAEVIKRSFSVCGITSFNPDEIHYTKVGGEAEFLRDTLLNWTPESAPNILFDDDDDDDDDFVEGEEIGTAAAAADDVPQEDGLEIDLEFDDLTLVDDDI